MKFLIVGLGNIGAEYESTRHNIGFDVVDYIAREAGVGFVTERYAAVATFRYKGRELVLIKPTTFMNLSGKAVSYWMKQEKVDLSNVMVIVDDLALEVGQLRIRPGGGSGGHNGLAHITEMLGSPDYPRLRFGIGNNFPKGFQVDYVLGKFSKDERTLVDQQMQTASDIVKSFAFAGLQRTMNTYNKKN